VELNGGWRSNRGRLDRGKVSGGKCLIVYLGLDSTIM
jgi:hypothetical protein